MDNVTDIIVCPQPVSPKPDVVLLIDSITADLDVTINPDNTDVTCRVGTTLAAVARLTDGSGATLPVSATFRMPVTASDGREIVALAQFVSGVAEIAIPFTASGIWAISEATINRALPPTQQMQFVGITVYVVV